MPKKRHMEPEDLLQRVITALEDGRTQAAVLALLSEGPLRCSDALLREIDQPAVEHWDEGDVPAANIVAGELLAYVRDLVRLRNSGFLARGIYLKGSIRLFGTVAGTDVFGCADGDMRELVILQFQLLLQAVGLRNVRFCETEDCPKLFVKTFRRTHCSRRCQKKSQMRRLRQQDRERQARQVQTRQRKRQGVSA